MTILDLASDYARLRTTIPDLEAQVLQDPIVAAKATAVENAKAMLRACMTELDAARQQHPMAPTILSLQQDLTAAGNNLLASWNETEDGKTLTLANRDRVQAKTIVKVEVTDGAAAAQYLLAANLWEPAVKELVLQGAFCRSLCEAGKLPGARAKVERSLAFLPAKGLQVPA